MSSKKSKKNQENILFLLMGVIIIGLIIAGFFLFQKQFLSMIKPKYSTTPSTVQNNTDSIQVTENVETPVTRTATTELYIPQEDVQNIQIYYGIKGKDKLEAENKKVRKTSMLIGQARQIVNSLLETPSNERLYRILPENLTLRGLFYDSGIYIIDFSREFNQIFNYGANEQILAVYSIVNSITDLDPQASVRFLVNGQEIEGEDGHVDFSAKLTRLESIIEK